MSEGPAAVPWYFYNSIAQIDDPLNFIPTTASPTPSATTTASPPSQPVDATDIEAGSADKPLNPPVFAVVSFSGSLSPVANNWTAFNPKDNLGLLHRRESESTGTLLVGHKGVYGVSNNLLAPVYWKSVRDTAHVHRGEWFFSSSLSPIDTSLEDAIAEAYNHIRPWTLEYIHELRSALDVPDAINKFKVPIEYTLNLANRKVATYKATVVFGSCYTGPLDDTLSDVTPLKYPVAYLYTPYLGTSTLNPINLLTFPTTLQLVSALLAGKPPPGIAQSLQRYFSWADWKKLRGLPDRPSDSPDYVPPPVTQLVLVIHGIGQKLSDRVESFNFTYAINGFNVMMTDLMNSPNVCQYLPDDANILLLPVNWRRTLDFESIKEGPSPRPSYTLDNITMKTIPSVRSLITDVMLDIPFYMSHYKGHMTSAAVREANRIYRLVLKYNPGFENYGHTHLIAHSLGSAIAIDILSTQPFDVTKQAVDDTKSLVFNTHNLFLAGSPAGFFLLLQNAQLTARTASDDHKSVFGLISVKNVYNILHHSDPIAYFLNPTVDAEYAAMLEPAILPGEKAFPVLSVGPDTPGFFDSLRSKVFGSSSEPATPESATSRESSVPRPPGKKSFLSGESIDRDLLAAVQNGTKSSAYDAGADDESENLVHSGKTTTEPVEVELQERDYFALRRAEKRMHLLNHNGQIDFMIPLSGALDNQYLSMLTAHSGYWENRDFARMVALECGRCGLNEGGLEQYAARKKK